MSRHILIIGGAGYIGSHMALHLREAGERVTVLDNLSQGHADAVGEAELIVGDVGDAPLLERLFSTRRFDAVMHFASSIQVGESVRDPGAYYANNVARTVTLLNALVRHPVGAFIFSSSAAVFGDPERTSMDEEHPCRPVNPYGRSKRMVEEMLLDYARAYDLPFAALRYFNAAGADPKARLGERHEPETHLIPLALRTASGECPHLAVYGEDYATPDGTCIRDYVHVCDLAGAHALAMEYLWQGGSERFFNLGAGRGYSVREVIAAAEAVTGRSIPLRREPRRAGDPPVLVADGTKARALLGWRPHLSDLPTLITHAWAWEKRRFFPLPQAGEEDLLSLA